MARDDVELLAQRWLQRLRSSGASEVEKPWSEDVDTAVDNLLRAGDERAWEFLLTVVRLARDEDELATIGAGPAETFLTPETAAKFHDQIAAALGDPKFREALRASWSLPGQIALMLARAPDP